MVLIDLAPLGLTELAWLSCQNWPTIGIVQLAHFLGDLACRSVAELARRSRNWQSAVNSFSQSMGRSWCAIMVLII